MQIQDWTLTGAEGQPLLGRTYNTPTTPARGHLIVSHGFKGYQDYGFLPVLAHAAAAHGLTAHTFNFSHSGMTRHIETFERPDLFELDSWTRQRHDVKAVFEALPNLPFGDASGPVFLFGHSRGGVAAAFAASDIRQTSDRADRLAGLITAASPADGRSPIKGDIAEQLRQHGRIATQSSRTGQTLWIGRQWLDEIEADPDAFDPVRAAPSAGVPHLALHGDADDTVNPQDCHAYANTNPRCTAHLIEGATHTFNCPNPSPTAPTTDNLPPETTALIQAVLRFTDDLT